VAQGNWADGEVEGHAAAPMPGGVAAEGPAYGALDLGTNNCRLLIAVRGEPRFRVVDAFSRAVRLGERVEETAELSVAAMDRTIAALKVCAGKLRRRKVVASRAVATEACRRARNVTRFLARVREETGIAIESIAAEEEARLVLQGCAALLAPTPERAFIFDIGGGSTELIWAEMRASGPAPVASASIPIGVVNLAERHPASQYGPARYDEIVAEVAAEMRGFDERYGISAALLSGHAQILGTSGTVTTLAALELELPRYDRAKVDGTWLDVEAARRISRSLAASSLEERRARACIGVERADLIVVGCAIFDAICSIWKSARVRVADRGIREGILQDLMRAEKVAAN
jgi:exopolyphosphatase / guanosine-5'-triphosphate,3'-diphosphate pyrophosphatase